MARRIHPRPGRRTGLRRALAATALACWLATPAAPFESLSVSAPGLSEDLVADLRATSLLAIAHREGRAMDGAETLAAAQSDYGRLIGIMYEAGHYAPVIRIRLDGREAGGIEPLAAPADVAQVEIVVEAGPRFAFGQAAIAPVAPGTVLPEGFATGSPAFSTILRDSATAAVAGWRAAGHPRAQVAGQRIVADHRQARLDAEIAIAPGPLLRFGTLQPIGNDRTRAERVRAIAGLPTGEVFDPEALERAATRLRRTGTFASVALAEAERDNPDGTLDITATLVEAPLRRLGFGAEIDSLEGVRLSGYWLHRNLLGGAERLRVEGEIGGIGADTAALTDVTVRFAARYTRPATFTPDTDLTFALLAETADEEGYDARRASLGVSVAHVFSDRLSGEAGVALRFERVTDAAGERDFSVLALPLSATWDTRTNPLDPADGVYATAALMPFAGWSGTGSGVQLRFDARAYRGFGDSVVLAGRVLAGGVAGADICDTPRDLLFYSGGGGTVRGQPFRSLGATGTCGGTDIATGGQGFAALSAELRARVSETIGVVAFADAGHVSEGFFSGPADWHAGAGLGLRWITPLGPLRLDVAAPVQGTTGDGVQVYLGIGQAF